MSDGRRRRYRRGRDDRIRILAKRDDDVRSSSDLNAEIKPKILLKSKPDNRDNELLSSDNNNIALQRTIIVTRSDVATNSPTTTSPNTPLMRETTLTTNTTTGGNNNVDSLTQNLSNMQILEPVPKMTRPTSLISSTGVVNTNAKKLLMKNNTDFFVVATIGVQGAGKSTIMNLLANDLACNENYCRQILAEEESSIFRTRIKSNKGLSRSGTESMHMFITSDRVILLDTPPLLANPYKKDMTSSEFDDLHMIIGLLSVCHLLVVVQDDYMNLNFMRLLRFAEIMKPQIQDDKHFVGDYFPNVLFIKNRAKRCDYKSMQEAEFEIFLRACFNDSQLNMFMGKSANQNTEMKPQNFDESMQQQNKQKRTRANDLDKTPLSYLLIPNIEDAADWETNKQLKLEKAIKQLRRLVFMTPRNQMYNGAAELFTELVWFDMLIKVWQESQYFFLNTYEDMHRKVYDVTVINGNGSSGSGSNNNNNNNSIGGGHHNSYAKEMGDWKD